MHLPLPYTQHPAPSLPALRFQLFDVPLKLIEVVNPVVTHTDAPHFSFFNGFDEGKPRALARGAAAVGGVQQHEVDVGEAGGGEGKGDLGFGGGVGVFGDFAGEEEGGAREGRGEEGVAAGGFVAVGGGGVDLGG